MAVEDPRARYGASDASAGEGVKGIVVQLEGQADLPQIVAAMRSPGRFPRALHRRHEQGNEDADDRHDYQQLDERKRLTAANG